MAVDDLPGPVVNLLNAIGVPWPYVNEDTVSEFATLTRQFGQAVGTTHQDATETVAAIAKSYQGASSEAMQSGWATLSDRHVDELVTGCQVLADALDVAAGYIVTQKAEAIATLVGMAAAFIADQAASVMTLGLAEAAVPVIIEGAERIVKSLVIDLQQYVIGNVVEAAAKPLLAKLDDAIAGLDWSKAGAQSGPSTGFSLQADQVRRHTAVLSEHAATMRAHGTAFRQAVLGLNF